MPYNNVRHKLSWVYFITLQILTYTNNYSRLTHEGTCVLSALNWIHHTVIQFAAFYFSLSCPTCKIDNNHFYVPLMKLLKTVRGGDCVCVHCTQCKTSEIFLKRFYYITVIWSGGFVGWFVTRIDNNHFYVPLMKLLKTVRGGDCVCVHCTLFTVQNFGDISKKILLYNSYMKWRIHGVIYYYNFIRVY